jgi:glycosyltransferase involved in cell wall biosynthesis
VNFEGAAVLAHVPVPSSFSDDSYERYAAALARADVLLLIHPGAISAKKISSREQPLVERADQVFAWCGKFWFDKVFSEKRSNGYYGLAGTKLSLMRPAIDLEAFRHTPFPKTGRTSFLHVSNLSGVKAPDVLFLSTMFKGAELFIGSMVFGRKKLEFTQTYESMGQPIEVHFEVGAEDYEASKANDVPYPRVEVTVKAGGRVSESAFFSLGVMRNSDTKLNRFIGNRMNFYLHTSISEGLSASVLEAVARGLLPCITTESGLDAPSVVHIGHDPIKNRSILEALRHMGPTEYVARAVATRDFVQEHHSWKNAADLVRSRLNG